MEKIILLICLLTFKCYSQNLENFDDINFINKQINILKIDTNESSINRLEKKKILMDSLRNGFFSKQFRKSEKIDSLKLAKYMRFFLLGKYSESIDISKSIYPNGVFEIYRLLEFCNVIAYAHLNNPLLSMKHYNSDAIKGSIECLNAIQSHFKKNKFDLDLMINKYSKYRRKLLVRDVVMIGGGSLVTISGATYLLIELANALGNIDFR